MNRATFAVMALALSAAHCARPTELWLVVDSNVSALRQDPAGLRSVLIEVTADGDSEPFFRQSHDLESTFVLPGYKVVTPQRERETRRARVRIVGTLADGTELRQTALAGFGQGRRLRLDLFLARECAGAVQMNCESMGLTCGAGGLCIPIERNDLPEFDGATSDSAARSPDATVTEGGTMGSCTMPAAPTMLAALEAPRLVAPVSGAVALSNRPIFRWALPAGVTGGRVELCADPACATVTAAFEADGTTVQPSCDLPRGTVFFRVRARNGGTYGTTPSRAWQVRIASNSAAASALDGIDGDFNGDGLADLAYVGGTSIYLIKGVRGGAPVEEQTAIAAAASTYLEFVGDVNGDGVGDLAAAVTGGVRVVFGARAGGTAPTAVTVATPAGASGFGSGGQRTIASAGDVDGDGYSDFVVGAPTTNTNVGAAFIVFGDPTTALMASPLGTGPGLRALELYGQSVGGAVDTTGDGLPEVVVGAPGDASNAGRLTVWTFAGRVPSRSGTITGPALNARMGQFALALADMNGDGRGDIATSVNPSNAFQVGIAGTNLATPSARVVGPGQFTGVLVDGDGNPGADLIFYSSAAPVGVYLVRGGATFDSAMSATPIMAPAGVTMSALTGATGDFDGDGVADFVQATTAASLLFVRGGASLSMPVTVAVTRATRVSVMTFGN